MQRVKTDHNPCKGCGKQLEPRYEREHCGKHHLDRPEISIIMKKVTVAERKN